MSIVVKDGNGAPQTVKTVDDLLTSVSTAARQDAGNTTLAAILAKLPADPATGSGQAAIVAAIGDIPGGSGGGGDATAANQTSQIAQETAINTVLGTKTDAASTATDGTATSSVSIWKQISKSVQAIAASVAGTLTVGLPTGAATSANQTSHITQATATNTVLGSKTDAKSTATDATSISIMQVLKQVSASIQAAAASLAGTITVATHAVTQSGSWVISAGTNLIGKVTINDGTNSATVRAGSSAAAAGDAALVVAVRPDSLKDTYAEYETVAASQTDQALGATGASGDYLAGVLIIPAAAAAGAVSIKDGSGSSITIFAGGGTVALPTLAPIFVPLGIYSTGGAWKITTGANVSAIGIGDFT